MRKLMKIPTLLMAVLGTSTVSGETVTYQNGLSGYDGCSDTYLFSVGANPATQKFNFGRSELLKTAN